MNSRSIHSFALLLMAMSAASCSKHVRQACGKNALHLRHAPAGHPGPSRRLPDLRNEARARSQAAIVGCRARGERRAASRKIKYYKSTMMLGEISQTPRKDSMGMDMVPVYEGEEETNTITVDPVTVQKMGVRTGIVTKGPLRRIIRTVGVIDYNETALADVTTKFRGWIEKLYVDSTGKQVHKGEPLFEIYSPELYSAQSEYVLALNQGAVRRSKQSAPAKAEVLRHLRRSDRRTGKEPAAATNLASGRADRRHRGREDGGAGPDGGSRDEAVPAGRSRASSGCNRRSTSRTSRY